MFSRVQTIVLLLLLIPSSVFAADVPDYSPYSGTYEGLVFNGGNYDKMLTKLMLTRDGYLRGEYVVEGREEDFEGTLSNLRIVDGNHLFFEWTDQFGEGYEVLEFADDYNSFSGYWGNRESPEQFPLSGERSQ